MVRTGCDILSDDSCSILDGKRTALLANPASVSSRLEHTADIIISNGVKLVSIFGPQHGYRGDTQANMIEWDGYIHPKWRIPVISLYGKNRNPEASDLDDLDVVVIDLPDVGARTYTYMWTSVLMMRACAERDIDVVVLDRPNPIGGATVEGPLIEEKYISFVGLYPLPMRHGLTMAEALRMINDRSAEPCKLEIVQMEGWERIMRFEETGLAWIQPSPNMPSPSTSAVYPGTVMLEGANISEGRGTTKPFEMLGAPWIEPFSFAEELGDRHLAGAIFRPVYFTPTWDKYGGELCGGVQIHVTDMEAFSPVRCGATILAIAAGKYPEHFRWLDPPYEYEYDLLPIDIISGGPALRETVESGGDIEELFGSWEKDELRFSAERMPYLLY